MGTNRHDDIEVEVRVDGEWWPGWLDPDYWRKSRDGRWQGFVQWSKGPAESRFGFFDADDIRRV
jgi:hypothetical protein